MKNKVCFYQSSLAQQILRILVLMFFVGFCIGGPIYLIIKDVADTGAVSNYILGLSFVNFDFAFLFIYGFIGFEHNKIIMTDEYMYVLGDLYSYKSKVQYKEKVYFNTIIKLEIICQHENSLDKDFQGQIKKKLCYLKLTTTNNERAIKVCLLYYNLKSCIKIIDEIIKRSDKNLIEISNEEKNNLIKDLKAIKKVELS